MRSTEHPGRWRWTAPWPARSAWPGRPLERCFVDGQALLKSPQRTRSASQTPSTKPMTSPTTGSTRTRPAPAHPGEQGQVRHTAALRLRPARCTSPRSRGRDHRGHHEDQPPTFACRPRRSSPTRRRRTAEHQPATIGRHADTRPPWPARTGRRSTNGYRSCPRRGRYPRSIHPDARGTSAIVDVYCWSVHFRRRSSSSFGLQIAKRDARRRQSQAQIRNSTSSGSTRPRSWRDSPAAGPRPPRACFWTSPIASSPKWNTLAASTASAAPARPPVVSAQRARTARAITGHRHRRRPASISSMSSRLGPSRSME